MDATALASTSDTGIDTVPAILHVTHGKAGSQWIYAILHQCVRDRIVKPESKMKHLDAGAITEGKVYPTLYVTRQQFNRLRLPNHWRRFVVIRDLRDTLVSNYFSMKVSHPVLTETLAELRARLVTMSVEEGLLYMLKNRLDTTAEIQRSWCVGAEPIVRYRDLLTRDIEILERVLIDDCQLPVSRERLCEVVLQNRFELKTGGRRRGDEDITAHERKGIAGDWRNHFTRRLKREFKSLYGQLLIQTGYEADLDW